MVTWLVLGVVAAVVAVAWHAIAVAPQRLELSVLDIPVRDLPPAFDGYRIAVLTDFHHGPQQPLARARRAVDLANSQGPHLAVLLGDYGTSEGVVRRLSVQSYRAMFSALGPVLQTLRARDGVFGVLGNHDYYADATLTARWLDSIGVRVLRNEATSVTIGGEELRLVGLDDFECAHVAPEQVAALTSGDVATIVLSHHPDAALACGSPAVRLVLAGHTHGGQVVLPGIGALVRRSRIGTRLHPAGWIPNDVVPLFVSRGIGVQVPVRFRCPPEVVVVTLRRDGQHPA